MLALIAKSEVANLPGFGAMLMPGPDGFQHEQDLDAESELSADCSSSSGWPRSIPAGRGGRLRVNIPQLLEQSARHGYAMDWVDYVPGDGFYPAAEQQPGSKAADAPGGSYDAIRVYLWAGMLDARRRDARQILNAVPAMSAYLANHDAPPEKVSDQGIPLAQDGPVGFSAAVLPYLRAFPDLSRSSAQQMIRMNLMQR